MNISCRKTKCKFNKNYACTSKNIFVQKSLNCAYYEPVEKDDLQDVSKSMFEIAPEIAPFRDCKDINITCEADCIFNKCNRCSCNGIFVNGETPNLNAKKDEEISNDNKEYTKRKKKLCSKNVLSKKTFEIQNCESECSKDRADNPQKNIKNEAICFSFVKK